MDTRLVFRAGPVVFSQRVGGQAGAAPELFHPAPLGQVAAELTAAGWKVTGQDVGVVLAEKGWTSLEVHQVRGGVRAKQVTSQRVAIAWTIGVVVLVGLCLGYAIYR